MSLGDYRLPLEHDLKSLMGQIKRQGENKRFEICHPCLLEGSMKRSRQSLQLARQDRQPILSMCRERLEVRQAVLQLR